MPSCQNLLPSLCKCASTPIDMRMRSLNCRTCTKASHCDNRKPCPSDRRSTFAVCIGDGPMDKPAWKKRSIDCVPPVAPASHARTGALVPLMLYVLHMPSHLHNAEPLQPTHIQHPTSMPSSAERCFPYRGTVSCNHCSILLRLRRPTHAFERLRPHVLPSLPSEPTQGTEDEPALNKAKRTHKGVSLDAPRGRDTPTQPPWASWRPPFKAIWRPVSDRGPDLEDVRGGSQEAR